ncbi:MAG TPA: ACT domain-containing protein [Microthrixaceae bacterium]|nr:ACT domain-containing protein [Microthrixaceae bacterium]
MPSTTDLAELIASMEPRRLEGEYVFVTVDAEVPGLVTLATVQEVEGLSCVVARSDADRHGLAYDFVAAWISLTVTSALEAVGLTAAISAALAAEDISCNVIAGRYHDHLLVPHDRAADALDTLRRLAAG